MRDLHIFALEHAAGTERGRDVAGVIAFALPGECNGFAGAADIPGARSRAVRSFTSGQRHRRNRDAKYFVHAAMLARCGALNCQTNNLLRVSGWTYFPVGG